MSYAIALTQTEIGYLSNAELSRVSGGDTLNDANTTAVEGAGAYFGAQVAVAGGAFTAAVSGAETGAEVGAIGGPLGIAVGGIIGGVAAVVVYDLFW